MDAMRASALAIRPPARRGLWTGMGVGLAASLLLAVAIGTDTLSFGPKVEAPQIAAKSAPARSEEHTSELQSLMRISYAVFCLINKKPSQYSKYKHTTTHALSFYTIYHA